MDVERTDNFLPIRNLTEGVENIALMKAALKACADEYELCLLSVQGCHVGELFFTPVTVGNILSLDNRKVPKKRTQPPKKNRLKAGKRQIDVCTQESNSLELLINAVESKITASFLSNQASESEVLDTVRENRSLKRKIIALKHDMEQQEKLLQRANETMDAVRNNYVKNKKLKELPTVST